MAIIDILITVDAAAIVEQVQNKKLLPGTQVSPASIGAYNESAIFMAMAAQNGSTTDNKQEQPLLTMKAQPGDMMAWAINAFNCADNTVYLYNGTFKPGKIITLPAYQSAQAANYLPPATHVTQAPLKYENQHAFAHGAVLKTNEKVQYTCCFIVVNNDGGNIVGHFSWTMFIHIVA